MILDVQAVKEVSSARNKRVVAPPLAENAASSNSLLAFITDGPEILSQAASRTSYPCFFNERYSQASSLAELNEHHDAVPNDSEAPPNLGQLPPIRLSHKGSEEQQKSKTHSILVHQLAHKISSTFGNPTIVHRPKMRTRAMPLSMQEGLLPDAETLCEHLPSPQGSTTPSSYHTTGSISLGTLSTAKTSLESNLTSLHLDKDAKALRASKGAIDVVNRATTEEMSLEKSLTPIPEAYSIPLTVIPTVFTVETTANAKIFFETHFNALLAGHASPRTLRRRGFELHVDSLSLSEEQRQHEFAVWAMAESEHLRQVRILKSKSNTMNRGSGVAVAGYEVIRILGKGSFGVVRLVREKSNDTWESPSIDTKASKGAVKKSGTRVDSSTSKISAFEAFKATLDGQRSSQRRNIRKVCTLDILFSKS